MNALRTLSVLGLNLALVTVACGGDDLADPTPDPTGAGGGAVSSSSGDSSTSSGMGGDPSTTTTTGSTMVTSSTTGGMGGMGGMDPVDTTPPTIVSVAPVNGATGVANNEIIVINFSEPMDKPSAQAAFQSANLGNVTFAWPDDMTMEVTPTALSYAQGGHNVMANVYDYSITTVATDLTGNPLAQNEARSFATLRDVTDVLPETQEVSVEANGASCTTNFINIPVGRVVTNNIAKDCRLLVSYDLNDIAAGAQLQSADLTCEYASVVGTMPSATSRLEHVTYAPNNLAAGWSAAPNQTYANPFNFGGNITNPFDQNVMAAINAELAGQTPGSIQFRMVVAPSSLMNVSNHVWWRNTSNSLTGCRAQALEVQYLAP